MHPSFVPQADTMLFAILGDLSEQISRANLGGLTDPEASPVIIALRNFAFLPYHKHPFISK